jgi:outer membrane protein TolC
MLAEIMKGIPAIVLLLAGLTAVHRGLAAGSPAPVPAAIPQSVVLTPAYVNALADSLRTTNPAVRAAAARTTAAEAELAAVRTWEDPELRLGGQAADARMRAEEGDLLYGVEQKLPLFGKATRARRLAVEGIGVETAAHDAKHQLLRRDLAQALFRVAFAQRTTQVATEDIAWLDTMVQTTEARYRVGEVPQSYLLRLQNERSRRGDERLTLERRVDQELAAVNRLLARPMDTPWPRFELPPVAGEIVYSDRLVAFALTNEPQLKLLRQQVRQARAAVEVSRRQRYPEVALGAEARQDTRGGDFRQAMITLSVSLPWINGGKYRQDIRREAAREQAAELDALDYEWQVREEVRRLTVRLDAARREAILYRDEILPRSEQALAGAQTAWTANRAMFADVLEARRELLNARLAQARAVADQYEALAELVLCCGLGDLESLAVLGVGDTQPKVPVR